MKTLRIYILTGLLAFAAAAVISACNNEDEVVPLNDRNTSAKRYKALTPVLLTDEEQDQVQAIRDEYREATN